MLNRLLRRVGHGRLFGWLLVTGCLCTAAQSQQPSYTWEQIRDLGLSASPTLRAQAQSVVSSRAGEVTASLRPNPQFQNDTTSATAGIYQEFEIGGKRPARVESARLATSISQTDLADTRRILIFNLRQAFVSALLAKSDLAFAQDNLIDFQKIVDLNRLMLQQGTISRANFLKIELQTLQFQTDVDDATLALNTAKATLRGLIGPSNVPLEFDVQGQLQAIPLDKTLPELQQMALSNRPDLKSAETAHQKTLADLRLAKANRWPDPTIGASFLHTGSEIGGPNWFQPFYPKGGVSNAMGIGIASISIPLFNRNQGEIARASSEQLRSDFLVQAARARVIEDVETAYASFQSSRNRVRLYEPYLSRAKEALDIEEFSFRHGAASALDFLDAERTYRSAQFAYRQQLAAYLNNLAQLEAAVGVPIAP